jgi:hypothetical protein
MRLLQNRRWATIGGAVLLLLALGIWAGWSLWSDPHMARVQELRQDLSRDNARNLSREERREKWTELRAEMDKLSPVQKRDLFEERAKAGRERMDKFFKMSKAEQTAALDKMIKGMQAMRNRQANQAQNAQQGGNPGGWGRGRSTNPEERQLRRQQFLDMTTPEDRAQRALFRQMLNSRMQQLGIPAGGGWGGGWGRPRRQNA